VNRIATARNAKAARISDRAKATAKAEDSATAKAEAVETKHDLPMKVTAKTRKCKLEIPIIKSSLALGL